MKFVILNSKNEKFKISNFCISVLYCKTLSIYYCLKSSRQRFQQVLQRVNRERFPLFFQSIEEFLFVRWLPILTPLVKDGPPVFDEVQIRGLCWLVQMTYSLLLYQFLVQFGGVFWIIILLEDPVFLKLSLKSLFSTMKHFCIQFFLYCSLSRIPSTLYNSLTPEGQK